MEGQYTCSMPGQDTIVSGQLTGTYTATTSAQELLILSVAAGQTSAQHMRMSTERIGDCAG